MVSEIYSLDSPYLQQWVHGDDADLQIANRSIDPESYQQYLRAKPLARAGVRGVQQAIKILEPVVARYPDFAPAWAVDEASRFVASRRSEALRQRPAGARKQYP